MPEMFMEMFKEGIFTFEIDQWNSKDEKTDASTVTNTGVVNILGNVGDTVIVTMYYNGVECYHMEFKIAERSFSGGMGIKDCPYLISNKDQFENITKYNAAFKLIDNIDFKGASIAPLGTLTGALDGNGFAVYGFTMSVETNAGLFDQVANGASVKNLTLGGIDNEKDYLVTISAGPNYSDELIAGGICAINYGVIENCAIMQTKVYSGRDVNQPTEYKIIGIVGGITGRNYSIIRNCVVEKSLVQTDSKTQKDNHPAKCYAYSGGIAGINEGQIFDCSASNNKIIGYTYSKDENGFLNTPYDEGRGYTYCAGITANNKKTIENVYVFENYIEAKASCDSGTAESELFYAITSGTQNNCIEQKYNCIRKVSSIEVTENSYKESYYSGEYIDFSNLVVKDNNGEIINGYKVSGYDSNVVGSQPITVSYITGYGTIEDTFDITVLDIEAEELVVFSKPANTTQELNAVALNTNGLMLLVKYNDGTSKILNNGEGAEEKEYTQRFDFSEIGKTTVTFNYEGLVATMDVEVACTHKNTLIIDAIDATCTNAGYTKGVYCNNCNSYVSGHEEIPRLNEHPFGNWIEYSEQQHSRVCPCGDVEYAGHDWDEGVVTIEPTFTTAGELTKTCPDCGATKTEVIDPIDPTGDSPCIVVDSKNAMIGQTVSVNISLKNNPGITSMRINVAYDSAVLRLTGVEYNIAMGGQSVLPENIEMLDGTLILYWTDGFQDFVSDDVFATFTFEVSPDAVANTSTSISVTYDTEDIYDADEENVLFVTEDGIITFIDYIPGDINGDGVVNTKDTTRLMRYLAGWDVEVNEAALDVNGDDIVNTKDTTRLMRYLAGWDVEIH